MKKITVLCLLASVLCLTGCAGNIGGNMPQTKITANVAGQTMTLNNPKDTIMDGLEFSVDTNRTAHLHIDHISTVMNPTNIAATGSAMADVVNATGTQVNAGIDKGIALAGKFLGGAVGGAVK
jgi:hypothetical protein